MDMFKGRSPIVALAVAGVMAVGTGTVNAADHWSGARDTKAPALTTLGVPKMTDKPFTATFVFSERVLGFDRNGVTVTNASLSDFHGNGKNYQVRVKPNGGGSVRITIIAHSAADMAGNKGPASDVSAIISVSSVERLTEKQVESEEKRRKEIQRVTESGLNATTKVRQETAKGVMGEFPDLPVEPVRITEEDESWVFQQQKAPQPQQREPQP